MLFLDLGEGPVHTKIQTRFSQKLLCRSEPNFFMKDFQVLYVLCFTRPRYQVSVYRTTGPLVTICGHGGYLGHGTSILSSDVRFLVPESFHKNFGSDWQMSF